MRTNTPYRSPYLRRAVISCAWILTLTLSAPTSVRAEDAPQLSAKDKKKARALIKRAKSHRKAADQLAKRKGKRNQAKARARYKQAVIAYRDAYRLLQMPALLVPMGQLYQARGETAWAVRMYNKYVELKPDGPLVDDARGAIAELETQLASDEQEAGDPELDPTDIIGPEPEPVTDEDPEQADDGDDANEPDGADEPDSDGEITSQKTDDIVKKPPTKKPGRLALWSGIGGATLGAALVGTGVGFGVSAQAAANSLSANDDAWTAEDQALIATGKRRQTNMYIFTSLGAVFIAGGATLFYLGLRANKRAAKNGTDADASAILVPSITPESATLTITGRF